jgi:hypothetical protein
MKDEQENQGEADAPPRVADSIRTYWDPIPETVNEALAIWDSGESVFSVEMGGIGPGYEMAIQGLAFELMRLYKDVDWTVEPPSIPDDEDIIHACDSFQWGCFSGAQVGAARNLAAMVCRHGYRNALRNPVVSDRLIQVCKKDLRA